MIKAQVINQVFELTLRQSELKEKITHVEAYLNEKYWEYKKAARNLRLSNMAKTRTHRKLFDQYKSEYDKLDKEKFDLLKQSQTKGII